MRSAAVVAALVCLGLCVPGGAAFASADGSAATPPDPLHERVETDRIVLTAAVGADGDARWRIEYRTDLDDENTTEAFEGLQEDVQADPANYTDRFAERIRTTVRTAENATGREMTASGFDVAASIDAFRNQGVVAYTFEWSNFAHADGTRILIGDAIAGFALYSDTRLEIQWPEGYDRGSVDPPPSSSSGRSVIWRGTDVSFGPDQPSVEVFRSEPTPTATAEVTPTDTDAGGDTSTATETGGGTTGPGSTTATPTDDTPTTTTDDGTVGPDPAVGGGGPPVGLLLLLALVVVAAGVAYWRWSGGSPASGSDDGSGPPPGEPTANGGSQSTAAGSPSASAGTGDDPAADSDAEGGTEPPVDPELLSNEERVLHLLEQHGGRMKQQEVVEELGWTEAKTSQVVTGMREDDQLDGFRLGRENVLTLPETEIDPTGDEEGGT